MRAVFLLKGRKGLMLPDITNVVLPRSASNRNFARGGYQSIAMGAIKCAEQLIWQLTTTLETSLVNLPYASN